MPTTKTCDEYSTVRRGVCDRPLDEHGNCDRWRDHGDHLADRDRIVIEEPARNVPDPHGTLGQIKASMTDRDEA